MKVVTPEQMKSIDLCASNEYGIPSLLLMENAASAVAREAALMTGGAAGKKIVVAAGRGNNGGDAFAAARLLHSKMACLRVYLVGRKEDVGKDALMNMNILERIGIGVQELKGGNDIVRFSQDMETASLVIDGIFGTGLGRDVDGVAGMAIDAVNKSGKPVLAIDIPSGIDGMDGSIRGKCIKADVTVTFCLPKMGLLLNPGREYAGRLVVADIGIPPQAIDAQKIITELVDRSTVSRLIPARRPESNKGDYGRVFIITGSPGMTGSGCLSSMAALRVGAGLVYAGVPESIAAIYGSSLIEPVIVPLKDEDGGFLSDGCIDQIKKRMGKADAVAIGPGLSVTDATKRIIEEVVSSARVPLVLDADALNAIAGNTQVLKKLGADAVITPHPGEMARLTGFEIADVQRDRVGIAARFAAEFGVTVVLKGNRTIIACPDGRIFINPTGNAGMATAGSGDVLTGAIAGLIAQGTAASDAAVAGVYIHGMAGDAAAAELGMHGMLAGDVLRRLPQVIKKVLDDADGEGSS